MIFIAISTCPLSSIPKAQDPSAVTRSTWSLPVNGNFSDLLRGELLQIKEAGKKKRPREGGDLLMVWLVASNPLVVNVAGSEHDLFFLFWIFFRREQKYPPRKFAGFSFIFKTMRTHLFHRFLNGFIQCVGDGLQLLKKTSPYPGIKGDTQIQQTKGRVLPKPSDVEMILLIDKIW